MNNLNKHLCNGIRTTRFVHTVKHNLELISLNEMVLAARTCPTLKLSPLLMYTHATQELCPANSPDVRGRK